ncbi:hypothetical protein [Glycomyces sp. NRRL B-16210]|uniref:hypothetical protein n=1 Tax=Glycomyces sp. NRRL B-16210 TaxID=1463821 RepID=UPI0004C22B2D|nr:hypothetical protein [Glycomyces sp. NRRL B-16210]
MEFTDAMFASPPVARLVLVLAAYGAAVFALTAKRVAAGAIGWAVVYACWLVAVCVGGNFWESGFAAAVACAHLALPPLALVAASWRLERGRGDAIAAEIGLLVGTAVATWIVMFSFSYDSSADGVPVANTVWFAFLAAVFVASAFPVPTRRIAYGAAALASAIVAVFGEVLLWSETGQHPDVPFNDDLLVAAVFVGIPLIGTLAQIAWCARRPKTSRE